MSSENIKPFKNQVYSELKSQHSSRNLFEDPLFPANNSSLCYNQSPPYGVKWRRPKEVRPNAQFVVDGFGRCDMDQGALGNCWFIAACAGIMQSKKLFAKIVPSDQSFSDDYAGIFHFRFWVYGEWVDVVVDDRLPFKSDGTLIYCSNKEQPDEFWGSLLEKAYAKLYGCYENLDLGQIFDALIDMSGGIQEQFDLKKLSYDDKANFWKIIDKGFEKQSILGCSINPDPRIKEARMSNGLVRGHAYTITNIVDLKEYQDQDRLIRIRNPWGGKGPYEWNGAWSDGSPEWNSIPENEKQEIGLIIEKDGEFWMSYSDFMRNWDSVQICHLTADSFSAELLETDDDSDLSWKCTSFNSAWVTGSTAGGSGQYNQAKYWTNPQFLINLTDVDTNDNDNKADVVVALMQKDSRLKRMRTQDSSAEEYIQFKLFKIRDGVQIDDSKTSGLRLYGNQLERIDSSGPYINSRDVTKRFRVDPGHYLIIPSTYDEDHDCEFLLRVFTETPIEGNQLDQQKEDDLTEDDTFFERTDDDDIFNEWIKLFNPKCHRDNSDETDAGGKGEINFSTFGGDGDDDSSSGFSFSYSYVSQTPDQENLE